jgi:SIR2-like domain
MTSALCSTNLKLLWTKRNVDMALANLPTPPFDVTSTTDREQSSLPRNIEARFGEANTPEVLGLQSNLCTYEIVLKRSLTKRRFKAPEAHLGPVRNLQSQLLAAELWSECDPNSLACVRFLRRTPDQFASPIERFNSTAASTVVRMIRFFSEKETLDSIEALAKVDRLTVFVGAGASREVGLPTWNELLRRLWSRAASTNGWIDVEDDVFAQLNGFGALGAAERIQCSLTATDLTAAIREALYEVPTIGGSVMGDAKDFQPGPISDEIAKLRQEFGSSVTLATTNYDQLLLKSLRENGLPDANSYCLGSKKPGVIHLHGVVGFEDPDDGENVVVLTERDYLAPTNSGWREDFLKEHLEHPCLFVGASLTDLNFLSPLHKSSPSAGPRIALMARPTSTLSQAQLVLEEVERKRFEALGVKALFADEYSDLAQFIHEVRISKAAGFKAPLTQRWGDFVGNLQTGLLSIDPKTYRSNQKALCEGLQVVIAAMRSEFSLGSEVISIGLCALLPPSGSEVRPTNWVSSDREMVSPDTIEPLRLDRASPWTSVKAICAGVRRVESKSNYASRWHYLWAEPIFSKTPRLPLGAVVLSTMADETTTLLPFPGRGDSAGTAKMSQILQDVGAKLFGLAP